MLRHVTKTKTETEADTYLGGWDGVAPHFRTVAQKALVIGIGPAVMIIPAASVHLVTALDII